MNLIYQYWTFDHQSNFYIKLNMKQGIFLVSATNYPVIQLVFTAKYHHIPFYVAAPTTSIDLSLADGSAIVIEERPPEELTLVKGMRIAAPGIGCWNPAFDVTPAELITGGIITELGVFKPAELARKIKGQ